MLHEPPTPMATMDAACCCCMIRAHAMLVLPHPPPPAISIYPLGMQAHPTDLGGCAALRWGLQWAEQWWWENQFSFYVAPTDQDHTRFHLLLATSYTDALQCVCGGDASATQPTSDLILLLLDRNRLVTDFHPGWDGRGSNRCRLQSPPAAVTARSFLMRTCRYDFMLVTL